MKKVKEYVLTCPNALVNKEKGIVISTQFFYNTLQDAQEHKSLCDAWDKLNGNEPTSYIEEKYVDSFPVQAYCIRDL